MALPLVIERPGAPSEGRLPSRLAGTPVAEALAGSDGALARADGTLARSDSTFARAGRIFACLGVIADGSAAPARAASAAITRVATPRAAAAPVTRTAAITRTAAPIAGATTIAAAARITAAGASAATGVIQIGRRQSLQLAGTVFDADLVIAAGGG